MALVRYISVKNLRSHSSFESDLKSGVTVITGPNGSGKTTIIEAIYSALQGTALKGSDIDMLKNNQPWWRVDITLDDNTRTIKFDPEKKYSRKQFLIDSKTTARLPQKLKYPVVLFEPEDLRLINGSPTRRRYFIDKLISQIDSLYSANLRKYDRALKQRNNLLKQHPNSNQIFVWDVAISEYGEYIINKRLEFVGELNKKIVDAYQKISKTKDQISITYSYAGSSNLKQKLLNDLSANFRRDVATGNTSVGPHRHDILFSINNKLAISTASRGEVRTIILALKFLEVDILEEKTGKKPIVLLDDVFSELDETRQNALSNTIHNNQIIITSTHTLSKSSNFKEIKLKYNQD